MFDERITIFTGHFGSGKTEVAVNYARQTARAGKKTAIVDLDIVNPFFRTADVKRAGSRGHQGDNARICQYECGCAFSSG